MMKQKRNYNEKKVSVFDIDGTIYMESLLMKHYELLIEDEILPKSELLNSWMNDKKNESLIYQTANEYKERLKAITLEQAKSTAKDLVGKIKLSELHPFVINKIAKYKRDKTTDIVLISGSPKFIVKEFAKVLGVKGYGSIYETCDKGFFNGDIQGMWGEEHKEFLMEHLGLNKAKEIIAFGDTGGDLGLYKFADKRFLIEPTEQNESRIKKVYSDITIIR